MGAGVASLARVSARLGHGTRARWTSGCRCSPCRQAHTDAQRSGRRARAQAWLPAKVRQRLLKGIYAGTPFKAVIRDLVRPPSRCGDSPRLTRSGRPRLRPP